MIEVDDETARVRRLQDKAAPKFDQTMGFFERHLFQGGREWVCSQATGRVLEIAVGTGLNLPYYPDGVDLTGIELSPAMLELANERLAESDRKADYRLGDAQQLEFADESFDTVICTFSLCTIPDDRAAVVEAHRVLKPGGTFVAIEHVGSPSKPVWAVQRLIEFFSVRLEGDHQTREPLDHVRAAGFEVEALERSKWGIVERLRARKAGREPRP